MSRQWCFIYIYVIRQSQLLNYFWRKPIYHLSGGCRTLLSWYWVKSFIEKWVQHQHTVHDNHESWSLASLDISAKIIYACSDCHSYLAHQFALESFLTHSSLMRWELASFASSCLGAAILVQSGLRWVVTHSGFPKIPPPLKTSVEFCRDNVITKNWK